MEGTRAFSSSFPLIDLVHTILYAENARIPFFQLKFRNCEFPLFVVENNRADLQSKLRIFDEVNFLGLPFYLSRNAPDFS